MDDDLNRYLSKISMPLDFILRKYVILLLNGLGDIQKVWSRAHGHLPSIARKLMTEKNIRSLFEIPGPGGLSGVRTKNGVLIGRAGTFVFGDGVERFYSSLPLVTMRVDGAGPGRFLGFVTFTDLLPNFFERSSGCLVLVDDMDRIKGFNHSFCELFQDRFPDPQKMLDTPAVNFFSPTPQAVQENALSGVSVPPPESFRTFYEKDYAGKTPGLQWTGASVDGSLLTLPEPFDLAGNDLVVRVELGPDTVEPPSLILGDQKAGEQYIDHNGYLLGHHRQGRELVLKRGGFLLRRVPYPEGLPPSFLEFRKSGNALAVSGPRGRLLAYYDHDFVERGETFVSLFLRQGSACVLKKVLAAVRPVETAAPRTRVIVKMKAGPDRYFLLNRFENFSLSSTFKDVTGFRLQDVSELHRQMDNLETRYREQVRKEKRLQSLLEHYRKHERPFVGSGKAMAAVREKAERVADTSATILIQGRTGTGKEVLAQYIHGQSPFHKGPFIKVDCATIPQTLMESELFGHEKGAFTGAIGQKTGMFEKADKGTLFLDEANNLPFDIQAKLLQFMQEQTITRVGGGKPIKLNLRILVASSLDIREMIKRGRFREDLYFRMAVVTINVPLLKDRLEDLPELCNHFMKIFNAENNKDVSSISPAAFRKMYAHGWPGNIRELRNVMERAVIFCDGPEILPGHIHLESEGPAAPASRSAGGRKPYTVIDLDKGEIAAALRRHKGMVKRVAEELGVTRRALYFHFKRLKIKPNMLRKNPRKKKPLRNNREVRHADCIAQD